MPLPCHQWALLLRELYKKGFMIIVEKIPKPRKTHNKKLDGLAISPNNHYRKYERGQDSQ